MSRRTNMYKFQDYNNSAHPVTCEDQHLTRILKHLHDRVCIEVPLLKSHIPERGEP